MTLPNVDYLMFDLMLDAKRRKLAKQRRSLDDATPEEWDALKVAMCDKKHTYAPISPRKTDADR